MDINQLFPIFASLIGFPAFVAAAVNAGKYFGLVQDGQAPAYIFWSNIVIFILVAVAYFTGRIPVLTQVDAMVGNLALFMLTFVSFITELGFTKIYHAGLKGTPVIGASYTDGVG